MSITTGHDTVIAYHDAHQTLNPVDLRSISSIVQNSLPMQLANQNVLAPQLAHISLTSTPVPASAERLHIVAAGETLSAIADSYNLHIGSLLLANTDLTNTEVVIVGQVLRIPETDFSSQALAQEYQSRSLHSVAVAHASEHTPVPKAITPPAADTTWHVQVWPVVTHNISQGFSSWHLGIDITGPYGSVVRAASAGCATVFTGWNGGYGNYIKLTHSNSMETVYAHLSSEAVTTGQCVEAGKVIGYLGSTGNSTGPHVHFEVRSNGTQLNPLNF